ncbi:MAG: LptF/LptG family permease [Rikenellaceae bacterium]
MRLGIPGLKTLDRYIIGKFLATYFFANAMIIVIVVIIDYAEKVDDFTELKAPMEAIAFDYYLNFIPSFINQFSGLFAFISVIFFTSKMAYQTEIIAMLSGGMSFRRLMWPYFVGSLIIASLSLSLNLWVIPVAQRTSVDFEIKYLKKHRAQIYDRHIYRQVDDGLFVYLRGYNTRGATPFFALESYDNGKITATLEAASVRLDTTTGRWSAKRYTTRTFSESGEEIFTLHRDLDTMINLDRAELGKIGELVKTMKIEELNDFLEQQKVKGSDSVKLIEVAKHTRFAYPLGTFILSLIGVSLSSRKVRGGTGLHIGLGTGLCFSYILFARFFEEFAKGGTMPPEIAVWAPNIIYLFIAIYCYNKAPK